MLRLPNYTPTSHGQKKVGYPTCQGNPMSQVNGKYDSTTHGYSKYQYSIWQEDEFKRFMSLSGISLKDKLEIIDVTST